MARANAEYYATHDPFGAAGDFITAPEISQMFGEIVGLWLIDLWRRAGKPAVRYVELGPGRGTLAEDALRVMRNQGLEPPVDLVETSPILRATQADRVPRATWHAAIRTLPDDAPLLVVANEFFDALPVRQFVRAITGWRERMVGVGPEGFRPEPGREPCDGLVPARLRGADPGGIYETSPAAASLMKSLARRIAAQGGAILAIDYGYAGYAAGDTLQAVHAHAYADPFAKPGASDLTAHVDFSALANAAEGAGLTVSGPVPQGDWLTELGIGTRAALLGQANPRRIHDIEAARHRLTDGDEMGHLFKALAAVAPGWPAPAGFGEEGE